MAFESNPLCRQGLEIFHTIFGLYDCAEPMLGKYVYISLNYKEAATLELCDVQVFMNEGKFPLIYLASPVSGLSLFFGVCFDAVHLPPPPPNPTLTPTLLSIDFCWVRGGGRWEVAQILKLILLLHPPHHQYVPISIYISVYSFFPRSQKRL